MSFSNALEAETDFSLLTNIRKCTKNGITEKKENFYQYGTAWDFKHKVMMEESKFARVLFELQQMQDGDCLL